MTVVTEVLSGDGGSTTAETSLNYTVSYDYDEAGSYTPRVRIVTPTGCSDVVLPSVTVPPCPTPDHPVCPRILRVDSTIRGCANGDDRNADVGWFAVTDPAGAPGTFTWRFDRGPATAPSSDTGIIRSYTAPGPKTAEVTFAPDREDCPVSRTTELVDVPACDEEEGGGGGGGSGGGGGGGESLGCLALRVLLTVLTATAILCALLAICLPAVATELLLIAGGALVLAVLLALLWGIACDEKPCGWGLLLASQAALGAGVAATVLSGCCPWMLPAGLGLIVVGLAGLIAWRSQCDMSWCRVAREIVFVVGGIILPLIGVIAGVPLVNTCVSGPALAGVGLVFGPIAVYAAACNE